MSPPLYKKRLPVLLLEPSNYFSVLLKAWLGELGFGDVYTCATLRTALAHLKERRFGLIVCELKLDESTGFALAHETRHGASNANRLTPIIALSGRATNKRVETSRDLGITEFVCKPLSRKAFVQRVNVALNAPRNFIKAGDFFGPDRRRRPSGYDGNDRRRIKPRRVLIADEVPGAEVEV